MTDIAAIARVAIRRWNLQQLKVPRFAMGASLAALSLALGNAMNMAYVDPYTAHHRRIKVIPEDDLDGRDPDW